MSYATRSQVLSRVGRLAVSITATSTPNLTDLDTFLSDRSNQIDAALKSRGLQVPITTLIAPAEFVAECARLNAEGAAADAFLAAYITNDTNDRGTGAILLKSYEDTLDDWRQGIGIPVTVGVAEADLAVRSNATAVSFDPTARANQPFFARGMKF